MYNDSAVFNILATSRSCGNIHCSYQHYQPGKITLQVSVLMIGYLVASTMDDVKSAIFIALLTVTAEIIFEKIVIYCGIKKKMVLLNGFLYKGNTGLMGKVDV